MFSFRYVGPLKYYSGEGKPQYLQVKTMYLASALSLLRQQKLRS